MIDPDFEYRLDDLAWLLRRIESYHRKRLLDAGVPEEELHTVFVKSAMRGRLRDLCSDAAGWVKRLSINPNPRAPKTVGNRVPPVTRGLAVRAGLLADAIVRDGILCERNGVTAARTAIFAGWQFIRWEGGRPMECLSPANDAAAKAIDSIIEKARKQLRGNHTPPWKKVSPLVDWETVATELARLFIGHGACSPNTPRIVYQAKLCHSDSARPKDPQPEVDDSWWTDYLVG